MTPRRVRKLRSECELWEPKAAPEPTGTEKESGAHSHEEMMKSDGFEGASGAVYAPWHAGAYVPDGEKLLSRPIDRKRR